MQNPPWGPQNPPGGHPPQGGYPPPPGFPSPAPSPAPYPEPSWGPPPPARAEPAAGAEPPVTREHTALAPDPGPAQPAGAGAEEQPASTEFGEPVMVGEPTQEAAEEQADEETNEDVSEPEAAEPEAAEPESAEPAVPEPEPAEPAFDVGAALASLQVEIGQLSTRVAEVARLRTHDAELADRMHAEIVRLRAGELASALAPMITQLLRLHDRMVSLSGNDDATVAGMLRIQLLQILDTTADVRPFTPAAGDPFDAARHQGAARVPTRDRSADGTVARTVKAGFQRGDGSVVRVAEVDVHRFEG